MKKIHTIILILSMLLTFYVPALAEERTFEIWDQSPYVTSGYTIDYINVQKAIKKGDMKLYKLDSIGENYYFAICPEKLTGGGKKGNTDYSYFYGFVLCLTDDNYVVISTFDFRDNQYNRTSTPNIYKVSDSLDASYYTENKWEVPQYVISMKSKINNYDEYAEYVIITDTGNSYDYSMDMEDNEEGYPFILNQKLYMGYKHYVSRGYIKNYTVDGQNATYAPVLTFFAGTKGSTGSSMFITAELSTYDGYISLHESDGMSNVSGSDYYKIPNSDGLYMDYTFKKTDTAYQSIQVDIYKSINGRMYVRNSGTIATDMTTSSPQVTIQNPGEQTSVLSQSTPALLIGKYGAVIDDGSIVDFKLKLVEQQYYSNQITKYKGRLAIIRNRNMSGYYTAYDEDNTRYYNQKINYINILNSGELTIGEDIDLKIVNTGYEDLDGYFSYYTTFVPPTSITEVTVTNPIEWFGRQMSNVFPDGRYVECYWKGDGYYSNEIWYNIFDKSGTQIATGPTGYVKYFGDSPSDTIYSSLMPIAVNNSKFIVCMQTLEHDFMNEYYRSSVSHEQTDGEVDNSAIGGNKKLSQFQESDTQPVEIDIDLTKDELPIGFDIKDNVINSDKLESGLRDQINTIRLNDMV